MAGVEEGVTVGACCAALAIRGAGLEITALAEACEGPETRADVAWMFSGVFGAVAVRGWIGREDAFGAGPRGWEACRTGSCAAVVLKEGCAGTNLPVDVFAVGDGEPAALAAFAVLTGSVEVTVALSRLGSDGAGSKSFEGDAGDGDGAALDVSFSSAGASSPD
jgi:hypothetical protein